jgi:F0F1-type ATP synthase assembly protein I
MKERFKGYTKTELINYIEYISGKEKRLTNYYEKKCKIKRNAMIMVLLCTLIFGVMVGLFL